MLAQIPFQKYVERIYDDAEHTRKVFTLLTKTFMNIADVQLKKTVVVGWLKGDAIDEDLEAAFLQADLPGRAEVARSAIEWPF